MIEGLREISKIKKDKEVNKDAVVIAPTSPARHKMDINRVFCLH